MPKNIFENLNENRHLFLSEFKSLIKNSNENLFILVDKEHLIEKDYKPKNLVYLFENKNRVYLLNKKDIQLVSIAEDALQKMAIVAKREGVDLLVSSGYRSYLYQEALFNYYVRVYGVEDTREFSARAGTSQHQLGTTVDFGSIDDNFAITNAGKWLKKNASKYGWSLSYPKGFEEITGYKWECWHYRFLGVEACELQDKWFDGVQQYMLECIHCWNNLTSF